MLLIDFAIMLIFLSFLFFTIRQERMSAAWSEIWKTYGFLGEALFSLTRWLCNVKGPFDVKRKKERKKSPLKVAKTYFNILLTVKKYFSLSFLLLLHLATVVRLPFILSLLFLFFWSGRASVYKFLKFHFRVWCWTLRWNEMPLYYGHYIFLPISNGEGRERGWFHPFISLVRHLIDQASFVRNFPVSPKQKPHPPFFAFRSFNATVQSSSFFLSPSYTLLKKK